MSDDPQADPTRSVAGTPEQPQLVCWICQQPAIGVACSCAPISGAYCRECIEAGREPLFVLEGIAIDLEPDEVADWFRATLDATLPFYKVTEDEFWRRVADLRKQYEADEANRDQGDDDGLQHREATDGVEECALPTSTTEGDHSDESS